MSAEKQSCRARDAGLETSAGWVSPENRQRSDGPRKHLDIPGIEFPTVRSGRSSLSPKTASGTKNRRASIDHLVVGNRPVQYPARVRENPWNEPNAAFTKKGACGTRGPVFVSIARHTMTISSLSPLCAGLAQRMDVMSKITMTAAPKTIPQLGI